jgi:nicotinamidase-related amidase
MPTHAGRLSAVVLISAVVILQHVAAAPLAAPGTAMAAQDLPAIPDPVAVTLDPATTAFLVLDLVSPTCTTRPTCVASLPAVARLLDRARAANVFVAYSSVTNPQAAIVPEVAPRPDEPVVVSSVDKFYNTSLEELLRDRQIQTVILVGTAANGAVLYTAAGATQRGYTVVVAEDGISQTDDFPVFLTRYQVLNQPGATNPENSPLRPQATTLSRTDLITFQVPAATR